LPIDRSDAGKPPAPAASAARHGGARPLSSGIAASRSDREPAARIELTVDAPDRIFHALDPSPLVGRDLDDEVETYILECAQELPSDHYGMVIHVPGRAPPPEDAEALSKAIRAYFVYRRDEQMRRLRVLLREGRQALAIGLTFLFVCGAVGVLAQRALPEPFGSFLNEGLLIIGWVANWRPIEIFLYDWRPMRRQRDILAALGRMEIAFRPSAAA
jgi:hypothetical protein